MHATKSLCLRDHDEEGVTEISCSTKKDNSGREKVWLPGEGDGEGASAL